MRISDYKNKYKNHRRDLTSADRELWADAQDKRLSAREIRTNSDLRELIRNRNPVRWARLQRDFHWVQREMKKIGMNPEDARSIL